MKDPATQHRGGRRALAGIAIGALSLGAGTITALTTPSASTTSSTSAIATHQTTGVSIELIDNDFTLAAGDELRLVYRLTGSLATTTDIRPATTTTTTTTTTSTSTTSTTTAATTTTVAAADGDAPATPAPTSTAPVTTAAPAPTTTLPPVRALTVDIANFAPITDIDDADLLLGGDAVPGAFRNNIDGVRIADARTTIEVVNATTALLTLSVPTDVGSDTELSGPDSLEFPTSGVYPIRIQLLVDNDLVGTHGTLVERRPGPDDIVRPSAPVQFAVVTAAERPPGVSGDSDAQAVDRATAILEGAAETNPPLLASIPPDVLVAALERVNARNAGDDAATTVADDEFVALSDINLDVSSAVEAGLSAQYALALERGEESITAALSRPPTRVVRIVDTALSAPGAQLLRTLGVRYLVMTPTRYDEFVGGRRPNTDRFVEVELPDGGTLPILLTDPISAEFTTDKADETLAKSTTTEWATNTIAAIVLDHRSQGRTTRRSRLIGLDDLAPPDPRLINALVAMAANTPDVDVVAPTALVGTTDTQRPPGGEPLTLPDVAGPDLTARLATIETAKLSLISTASMLDDSDERLSIWIDRLDGLLSNGITDAEASEVIDEVTANSAAIRSSAGLPEPFTFTLTGRSDNIPLRLTNNGDEQLNVMVRLTSSKLTFPENDQVVRLRANDSTDIQVPVRARSNGTSPVSIQLLTPVGEPIGEPVSLTARVNSLTGLGQILTAGFLLMLGTWWFANWRKRRTPSESLEPDQA